MDYITNQSELDRLITVNGIELDVRLTSCPEGYSLWVEHEEVIVGALPALTSTEILEAIRNLQ